VQMATRAHGCCHPSYHHSPSWIVLPRLTLAQSMVWSRLEDLI
jgi:hypothetical protein